MLLALAMLGGAGVSGWQSLLVLEADWQASLAMNRIGKWVAGKQTWSDEDWESARNDLLAAVKKTPEDAVLYDALSQLHTLKALLIWSTGAPDSPEVALYRQALQYQLLSIRQRPLFGNAWANLSMIHYAISSPGNEIFAAWERARELAPQEPETVATLMEVAELAWDQAPESVRQWAERREPGFGARVEAQRAEEAAAAASAAEQEQAEQDAAADIAPLARR